MPYIKNIDQSSKVVGTIPDAESAKIAIVRPTTHFKIVTGDNPNMTDTLLAQEIFVAEKLNHIKVLPEQKETKIKELINVFQKNLSLKAASEQSNLLKVMKEHGICISEIVEDKGKLETADYDFFTDQIFATDTGQYYDDNGQLCFIPANFKNNQRKGEERLAIFQAENIGAKIQTLFSKQGDKLIFEGGDIRQMPGKKLFFIGQGHRSDASTSEAIAEVSNYFVIPIKLLQQQFYHLDCCFLPLPYDCAVIYEGEYQFEKNDILKFDANGWPLLVPNTETMANESRALIRTIYKPNQLILISKSEALAFATNAALLQSQKDKRFKLFVNGDRSQPIYNENSAINKHIISFKQKSLEKIISSTKGKMDIIEVPFSTMHGSGGSIRCTVQEVACTRNVFSTNKKNKHYFSDNVEKLEQLNFNQKKLNFNFFYNENNDVENDVPNINKINC